MERGGLALSEVYNLVFHFLRLIFSQHQNELSERRAVNVIQTAERENFRRQAHKLKEYSNIPEARI